MDSQPDTVVVTSPGGDGRLRAVVLAATQKAAKRSSEEVTSKITSAKKAKLSNEVDEETLVVEPVGEASGSGNHHQASISILETSANSAAEEQEEDDEADQDSDRSGSFEVPEDGNGSLAQELSDSGEAPEVGDDSVGGTVQAEDVHNLQNPFDSPIFNVFPNIDFHYGDLEEEEEEREEGPLSGPDYVIYSQTTSTSSQLDFSPRPYSQDSTGYTLGDIEL